MSLEKGLTQATLQLLLKNRRIYRLFYDSRIIRSESAFTCFCSQICVVSRKNNLLESKIAI